MPIKVDGYTIYVYPPEMIVLEKLRAICQQLPGYEAVIPSHTPRARARDFYDIQMVMEMHPIDLASAKNIELIQNIFLAKKVPTDFIRQIRDNKAVHADNWQSVVDTISPYKDLKDFNYYFDFVLNNFEAITFP